MIGTSTLSAAQAASRSPPAAEPPMAATTMTRGRLVLSGGEATSVRARRHWSGNPAKAPRASWGSTRASARRSSRFTPRSLAIDDPVDQRRLQPQSFDEGLQLLDEGDRAMPAARAADGDRQIGLALALIGGQDEAQEVLDATQQLPAFLVLHHELAHLGLPAVERPQLLDEMRIGQEAQGDQRVEEVTEVLTFPDVDAEGHAVALVARSGDEIGEGRHERGRQVVDTEEPHVLEALDRVRLAGSTQARDDHEGDRLRHGWRGGQRRFGANRRWCDGRIPSSSRYFATVRRAMVSPRPLRINATSWSESGFDGSSLASRSWIIFFTETDETISPSPEAMPEWKKNFSSNSPCGVSTYLLVVTRLIVDSCMPMSSPTSRSDSGRR